MDKDNKYQDYKNRLGFILKYPLNKIFYMNYLNLSYQELLFKNIEIIDDFNCWCVPKAVLNNNQIMVDYQFVMLKIMSFYLSLHLGCSNNFIKIFLPEMSSETNIVGGKVKLNRIVPIYGLSLTFNVKDIIQLQVYGYLYDYKKINCGYNSYFDGNYFISSKRIISSNFLIIINISNLINKIKSGADL
ncbi:hypothetical protein KAU33_02095 [Candidatus Dependentiae bacterium]|nr:hypothetical protein [Candidatus Dependentiae bacterium]